MFLPLTPTESPSTLYAAMMREVQQKGKESRFVKTGPGRFAYRDDARS